jgi:flavin-binding protein dodecin
MGNSFDSYSTQGEHRMSVARVTEIISSSKESFEDATRKGLKRASKTLKNVRGAWVEGQKVSCDSQGHIQEFRVILKVTFILED